MTRNKTPKEQLDGLLMGLEDEVLRSDLAGLRPEDGDVVRDTVSAMRSSIESLTRTSTVSQGHQQECPPGEVRRAKGVSAKVTQLIERLGQWAGMTQSGHAPSLSEPVRMAFSGERSEKVEKTARKTKRRRSGEAVGTKDGDS